METSMEWVRQESITQQLPENKFFFLKIKRKKIKKQTKKKHIKNKQNGKDKR